MNIATNLGAIEHYELRFRSLFLAGRALSFPCNVRGEVPIDDLSVRALDNYLFARAVVGFEYAVPSVQLAWSPRRVDDRTISATHAAC